MKTAEWNCLNEETETADAVRIVHFGCSLGQGSQNICAKAL